MNSKDVNEFLRLNDDVSALYSELEEIQRKERRMEERLREKEEQLIKTFQADCPHTHTETRIERWDNDRGSVTQSWYIQVCTRCDKQISRLVDGTGTWEAL